MKNERKKIIIWTNTVIKLIEGKQIGGIAVQMYFWAKVFAQNGWQVFSFKENAKQTVEKGVYRIARKDKAFDIPRRTDRKGRQKRKADFPEGKTFFVYSCIGRDP